MFVSRTGFKLYGASALFTALLWEIIPLSEQTLLNSLVQPTLISVAAICFTLSLCSQTIRSAAILTAISISLAIYSAEMFFEITGMKSDNEDHASGKKMQEYLKLKAENKSIFPTTPAFQIASYPTYRKLSEKSGIQPLANISNANLVSCDEGSGMVTWESDRFGFRNEDSLWDAQKIDVLFIGDSFTVGDCVWDGDSFVDVFASLNPNLSVLNLGIGGDGPVLALAKLREYARAIRPDIVIWAYYEGNDNAGLVEELAHPILQKYLDDQFTQNLTNKQEEINHLLGQVVELAEAKYKKQHHPPNTPIGITVFIKKVKNIFLLRNIRSRFGLNFHPIEAVNSNTIEKMKLVLNKMSKEASSWNGDFRVVYLPDVRRYFDTHNKNYAESLKSASAQFLETEKIDYLDIDQVFSNLKDPKAIIRGHFNEKGYKIIGEAISTWHRNQVIKQSNKLR